MKYGSTLATLTLAATAALGGRADAFPGGVTGYSGNPATRSGSTCSQCHGGGSNPSVAFAGPATVAPGSTGTYSLTISGGQQAFGALDVSATAGALAASQAGTKLSSGEITHTTRKAAGAGGSVTFQFQWTAPSSAGSATLYGAGLSADGDGGTDRDGTGKTTLAITVEAPAQNQAPTANPGGPYSGTAGQSIQFDGSLSSDTDGQIASYAWNFGDGSSGTGPGPAHTYAAAGSYTVSLTVTDDGGKTGTATTSASVSDSPGGNLAPTAVPGGPYVANLGQSIQFDGSLSSDSDGSIASYAWDFGDGSSGTGVQPTHTYAAAGSYTVSLTVTDDGGMSGSASTGATVSDVSQGGPLQVDAPERVKVREGKTKRVNIVVRLDIDPSSLAPGVETCGTVHLLKDGEEIGTQPVCVRTRAPKVEDDDDDDDDDASHDVGGDRGGQGGDDTSDDFGDDHGGSVVGSSDDGVSGSDGVRVEVSGVRRESSQPKVVTKKARFRAQVSAADAPSVEWSAFVDWGGEVSPASQATTEVLVKPGQSDDS